MERLTHSTLWWVRNDLRLCDNEALTYGISLGNPIVPVFILEDKVEPWSMGKASKWWLHHALKDFQEELDKIGLKLVFKKGKSAESILKNLAQEIKASCVIWNRAYEEFNIARDARVTKSLQPLALKIETFPGNVLFEPGTIFNKAKKPFRVFTPFYNHVKEIPIEGSVSIPRSKVIKYKGSISSDSLDSLGLLAKGELKNGFKSTWDPSIRQGKKLLDQFINEKISRYSDRRDFPAAEGTSHLSPYLHFGQISVKQIYEALSHLSVSVRNPYYRQIIWREFAYAILFSFPQTASTSFKREFEGLGWKTDKDLLRSWQEGLTGYPIVDAGMRELSETGWMHNRVRMIVGSFLVKDLMIHWVEGAKWFWDNLVDADLANNSFGWQWVAGSGLDASPFFRIFNPILQSKKFDPEGVYIKHFVPELSKVPNKWIHAPWTAKDYQINIKIGVDYPEPIVSHNASRINILKAYNRIRSSVH